MITTRLDLGFSSIQVTVNGTPVYFDAEDISHKTSPSGEQAEFSSLGHQVLTISLSSCRIGDIIAVEYEGGHLQGDGGGERRSNLVGTVGDYTVAFGCLETSDIERENETLTGSHVRRALPYELFGVTPGGYLFRIVDDPSNYRDALEQTSIVIDAVWEHSSKESAWEILSLLTC